MSFGKDNTCFFSHLYNVKNYLALQIYRSAFYPFLFICFLWLVFLLQHSVNSRLLGFGILPRTLEGMPGIITSVFVHGDLDHLVSNSFPILVLGMMLFYFYRKLAPAVSLWIWLISGLWLWVGGRNSDTHPMHHIGASTLIYGLASFLFFSGIFRRHRQLMVVSLLVVFLYGSITWGILPLKPGISWEGHLFGAIAGLLVAFHYRFEGPQRKVYDWELEEEDSEVDDPGEEHPKQPASNETAIRYIYRENKDGDDKTQGPG